MAEGAWMERERIIGIIEAMPNLEGPTRGRRAIYLDDVLYEIHGGRHE
jgi:hypothetical protein